jgi:hypothetical protein
MPSAATRTRRAFNATRHPHTTAWRGVARRAAPAGRARHQTTQPGKARAATATGSLLLTALWYCTAPPPG